MLRELKRVHLLTLQPIAQDKRDHGGRKQEETLKFGEGGLELEQSDLENRVSKCERLLYLLVGLQAPQLLDSLASTGMI